MLTPVIASAILCIGVAIVSLNNKVRTLEKRIKEYDKIHIEETMSQITTNLVWIKIDHKIGHTKKYNKLLFKCKES